MTIDNKKIRCLKIFKKSDFFMEEIGAGFADGPRSFNMWAVAHEPGSKELIMELRTRCLRITHGINNLAATSVRGQNVSRARGEFRLLFSFLG